MQLHELQRRTPNKKKKRVGRGGRRGKTSGKGHKGQKARAGGSPRPAIRDTIKKLPKLRGHGTNRSRTVNPSKVVPETVNLGVLDGVFSDGDTVTPATLLEKKLVRKHKGKLPKVKVLSKGTFTKKCVFSNCTFSEAARKEVEKSGSTIS